MRFHFLVYFLASLYILYTSLLVCRYKGKLPFFPSYFSFPHQSAHKILLKFCHFYVGIFFTYFS